LIIPKTEDYAEAYAEQGIDWRDVELMGHWTFSDMQVFDEAFLDGVLEVKDRVEQARKHDYAYFLDFIEGIKYRFLYEYLFYLMVGLLAIWLLFCRKNAVAIAGCLLMIVLYCYAIYHANHLFEHRVALPMLMTATVLTLYMTKIDRLSKQGVGSVMRVILYVALFAMLFRIGTNTQEWENELMEQQRNLYVQMNQGEDLYLQDAHSDRLITTFYVTERIPKGYGKNLYALGGWVVNSPIEKSVLEKHNVYNPFRECVDNPNIYVLDDFERINEKLDFVRRHYQEDADCYLAKAIAHVYFFSIRTKEVVEDLSDFMPFEEDIDISYEISENVEEGTIQIVGHVLKPNFRAFNQKVFFRVSKEGTDDIDRLAVQIENSRFASDDDGYYSGFACAFDKKDLKDAQVYLYYQADNLYRMDITSTLDYVQ
jgi:hypothetical protein